MKAALCIGQIPAYHSVNFTVNHCHSYLIRKVYMSIELTKEVIFLVAKDTQKIKEWRVHLGLKLNTTDLLNTLGPSLGPVAYMPYHTKSYR